MVHSIYYFGYNNNNDKSENDDKQKIKDDINYFIDNTIDMLSLVNKKKEETKKLKQYKNTKDNNGDNYDHHSSYNDDDDNSITIEKEEDESDHKGIMFVTDSKFMNHGTKMAKIIFEECGIQCRVQTYKENEQLPFENVRYTFRVNEVSINHDTLSFRDRKRKTQKQQILPYKDVIAQIKQNQQKDNNNIKIRKK